VQSDQQTIADYTAGTAATSPTYTYVYASYIDEPVMRSGSGNLVYLHRNQQYSIIALTNGSGTITERYAYSAYGTPTITDASGSVQSSSADNSRYVYTGREWDSSLSLFHYRARIYNSVVGRFCCQDPIGFKGSPWNLYEFVQSHPLHSVDPFGESIWGPDVGPMQQTVPWWQVDCGLGACVDACGRTPGCAVMCANAQTAFVRWYNQNRDLEWTRNLPACPCSTDYYIRCDGIWGVFTDNPLVARNPDPAIWNDPAESLYGYHEGARVCMRSKEVDGHASQCCYDANGDVITEGSGSGSADMVPGTVWTYPWHEAQDMDPADLANYLDGGGWGCYSEAYLNARPNLVPSNCKKNSGDGSVAAAQR
jgi:RHS repeat-associated protein